MEYLIVKNGPHGSSDAFVSLSDVSVFLENNLPKKEGSELSAKIDNIKNHALLSKGSDYLGEVDLKK